MNELKKQLSDRYEDLSPKLQIAARYVLEQSDEVALNPIREVAENANVTTNVLVRLAKELGFDGYAAFRSVFQDHLRQTPVALDPQRTTGALAELYRDIETQAHFNITQTLNQCGPTLVEPAIEQIHKARTLYVMGLRSCYPVAYAFYYTYAMFRENACLIEGHAGTLGDQLRPLSSGDVFMVISTSPFSRDAVQAARFAQKKGAYVLALVDQAITPFHDIADLSLECATHSKTLFSSTGGLTSLCEIMLADLLNKAGPHAGDAMDEAQKQLTEFNAYWQE